MTGRWAGSDRAARLPPNWKTVRLAVLDAAQWRCATPGCANPATDVDHITPGNDHNAANLQALCARCHRRKSAVEGNKAKNKFTTSRPAEPHPGLTR